jgi:hypothetical protein
MYEIVLTVNTGYAILKSSFSKHKKATTQNLNNSTHPV